MAWTYDEYQTVLALRGLTPAATYVQIAEALGTGKTPEAVRQKLISERVAARSGGSRSRVAWRENAPLGPCLGEREFLRRLMAGGGHSRFTEVVRNGGTARAYHALVLPMVGPDGAARPCGAAACQCLRPCGEGAAARQTEAAQPRRARQGVLEAAR